MKKIKSQQQRGFTLIELIVTLSIVAIISSIALPAFETTIQKNQQSSQTKDIFSSFQVARSEAIKRGQIAVICASDSGTSCSPTEDWDAGWIAFIDNDLDNIYDSGGDVLISVTEGLDGGYTLIGSTDIEQMFRFAENGNAIETGTITLCDSRGADYASAIIIRTSGRPKLSESAADGSDLTCPPP